MALWSLLVACIFVQETVYVTDSGWEDSGSWVDDEGPVCTSDDECPGSFACNGWTSLSTDGRGCVERCATDWDCKAGTTCGDDGDCR